jgi:chemotaxis protein MotB
MANNIEQPIIIKKVKKAAHAHHGGAWKIAYADFVTAMMAFFLLLWLISMTSDEQKRGLADYFAPMAVSASTSGAGGVLGGEALASTGAKMSGSAAEVEEDAPAAPDQIARGDIDGALGGSSMDQGNARQASSDSNFDVKSADQRSFHSAAASIKQAWQSMPEVTPFMDNLIVEVTEDGLEIQITDQQGRRMFPEGSKYPLEQTRAAIAAIAPILQQLGAPISISGHIAVGSRFENPRYGPWELSADRANVTRSILSEFGLSDTRVRAVTGRSTDEPFFPNDPYLAANERVTITVKQTPPPIPVALAP